MLRLPCKIVFSRQSLVRNTLLNRLKVCSSNQVHKCNASTDKDVKTATATFPVSDNMANYSSRTSLPLVTSRKLSFPTTQTPKQAWLETLSTVEDDKLGLIDLHPDVFGVFPRIDVIWENVHWQSLYRKVRYDKQLNRSELKGGNKKPWPQKRSGKARHGSVRSPLFVRGGKTFGPRGPYTYFYMLPTSKRVKGLTTTLSVKYAQDNLHIVDSLDLPTDEPEYLDELIESRGWGLSVLFVNDVDIIPRNIALATDVIKPYNVIPAYGLNVYSMLKHETLVLTLGALEQIEKNLLAYLNNQDCRDYSFDKKAWNKPVHPVYNEIAY